MKSQPHPTTPTPNAFLTTLTDLRKGQFIREAEDKMAKLVQSVTDVGSTGELTIKFKLKPNNDANGTLSLGATISVKTPQKAAMPTTYYATEEGRLVRDNPQQPELPIGVLDREEEAASKAVNQ